MAWPRWSSSWSKGRRCRSSRTRGVADPAGARHFPPDRRGARSRAREGDRPSRPEAGQHRADGRSCQRSACEGARLRAGEGDRAGFNRGPSQGDVQLVRRHGGRTRARHGRLQSRRPIGPWTTKGAPHADWTQRACGESGSLPLNNAYRVAHWMEGLGNSHRELSKARCTDGHEQRRGGFRAPRDRSIPGQSGRLRKIVAHVDEL